MKADLAKLVSVYMEDFCVFTQRPVGLECLIIMSGPSKSLLPQLLFVQSSLLSWLLYSMAAGFPTAAGNTSRPLKGRDMASLFHWYLFVVRNHKVSPRQGIRLT